MSLDITFNILGDMDYINSNAATECGADIKATRVTAVFITTKEWIFQSNMKNNRRNKFKCSNC